MSCTDYSAPFILNAVLISGSTAFPNVGDYYLAASTTTPAFAKGSGPYWNFTEPSDAAYARQNISWNGTGMTLADAFSIAAYSAIVFPSATVSWGTITYYGAFDSATGGNLWFICPLVRTVTDGETTSGSTTLESATASFTSGDVGAGVYGIGIPIGTTVVTYTNSTHVVMSAEANADGSGLTVSINTPQSVGSGDTLQAPTFQVLLG